MTTEAKYETKKAPKRIADLVAKREQLRAEIAERAKDVAEIDAKLEMLTDVGIIYDTPTHTLLMRPASYFNAKRFAEAFPATKKPKLYKRVLDTDAVKRSFSAAELEKFQDVRSSTIVAPKKA